MTTLYDVPAPAKLNLFLHVVGQRQDGYHCLQTVFRFVDLQDTLSFERRSDGVISRVGTHYGALAPQHDLVIRAAQLLKSVSGSSFGAQIFYHKEIPHGAGLGGGSSDAATTLIALNRLWGTGLSRQELMSLAVTLGADVPVFVFGDNAFAQGIGEQLQSVALPDAEYLLVQPPASVRTAEVFRHADLTRDTKPITMWDFTKWLQGHGTEKAFTTFGRNDLEPVVIKSQPIVAETARWLNQAGFNARMTGAGSCFFVESQTPGMARVMQQEILGKISARESEANQVVRNTWVCAGLPAHPLKHWLVS